MPTLREYFVSESTDYFGQLNEQLNRLDGSRGDPQELLRLSRGLRGSAHLAREGRVYRAGLGLEAAARAVTSGRLQWNPDIAGRARRTLEDLQALANGGEEDDAADGRVKRVLDRWKEIGVELPQDATHAGQQPGERSLASKQFREFAAIEVAGIANEIDTTLAQLVQDPRNRDILKAILRRQRALLGAARLDEVGVVAETLRAIEDLVRVIHKLNVAVKDEWATVFRAARDVLATAQEPLKQGNDPTPTPALSKLRTLRTELLDRYGEGDAVPVTGAPPAGNPLSSSAPLSTPAPTTPSPAPSTSPAPALAAAAANPGPPKAPNTAAAAAPSPTPAPGPQPIVATAQAPTPTPPQPAPAPEKPPGNSSGNADGGERVVPIEELCYSGEPALRRALELRPDFENRAGEDSDAREAVDELFDLIRLGIG
jgi:chemotaxis protein histidine kinase CheA